MTLLSQCIYGGKIDNLFDQRLLHSFLCKLFTPRSFEADFALVANVDGVSKLLNDFNFICSVSSVINNNFIVYYNNTGQFYETVKTTGFIENLTPRYNYLILSIKYL